MIIFIIYLIHPVTYGEQDHEPMLIYDSGYWVERISRWFHYLHFCTTPLKVKLWVKVMTSAYFD